MQEIIHMKTKDQGSSSNSVMTYRRAAAIMGERRRRYNYNTQVLLSHMVRSSLLCNLNFDFFDLAHVR